MTTFKAFLRGLDAIPAENHTFRYVSLFSGAGIGDYGLSLAGGKCIAACEIDPQRREVHKSNIGAPLWGNLRTDKSLLIDAIIKQCPDLLFATPPCQSFSTANSRRGNIEDPDHPTRDDRNRLFFEALEVARAVRPKVVAFENVPNFLKRKIRSHDGTLVGRVEEFLRASLSDYVGWCEVVCFSKLGVPQRRKRSLAIFIRNDCVTSELSQFPFPNTWPGKLSRAPRTLIDAIDGLKSLDGKGADSSACPKDSLHQVPTYSDLHYKWIADIPAGSGKSAWENACESCGDDTTAMFTVKCVACGANMYNRPHMPSGKGIRPIKGFKTSYKRMAIAELAPTITTASGHFSSDLKLHPTENRVLSARECAVLQTIPNTFIWPKAQQFRKGYLFREMIGEAVPPLVTYRLGLAVAQVIGTVKPTSKAV